jgi:predicted lipid-binding transport protein (Tim44 family)
MPADPRPPHQRWIKRPPRPSRPAPPRPEARERPGTGQLITALGFGLAAGIIGAILGPMLIPRPGMGGLFAGMGFVIGFITLWRGLGGTVEDIRRMFR